MRHKITFRTWTLFRFREWALKTGVTTQNGLAYRLAFWAYGPDTEQIEAVFGWYANGGVLVSVGGTGPWRV